MSLFRSFCKQFFFFHFIRCVLIQYTFIQLSIIISVFWIMNKIHIECAGEKEKTLLANVSQVPVPDLYK